MSEPSIVLASLSDDKLKESINSLVKHVNDGMDAILKKTNSTVDAMENKIKSLGNIKINADSSDVANSTRKATENQKSLETQTKKTTQSAKEQSMSFDQIAESLSKARRTISEFNTNRASGILPSSDDYKRYEQALARIVEYHDKLRQSALGKAISNEQAFAFDAKRAVKDIDAVDERLKQLNREYRKLEIQGNRGLRTMFAEAIKMPTGNLDEIAAKLLRLQFVLQEMRGSEILSAEQIAKGNTQISALLNKLEAEMHLRQQINAYDQEQTNSIQRQIELEAKYGDEVLRVAQIIRERFEKTKSAYLSLGDGSISVYNPAIGEGTASIEKQLFLIKSRNQELNLELEVTKGIANEEAKITSENERQVSTKKAKSFAEYEDLRAAIASVIGLQKSEVNLADSQNASYNALSATLKQLKQAYESLGATQRDSLNADLTIEKIHDTQRAMQEIQRQMARPLSLESALNLPEKTLDEMSYKIQMLRLYAQGVNSETSVGRTEITNAVNEVDRLNEKAKKLQKTYRQISEEANKVKYDRIAQMPEDTFAGLERKIAALRSHIRELRGKTVIDEKGILRAENSLDRLNQKLDKINLTRGTEKNINAALNMQANTLDEIAKKIQRLQAIRSNLNIDSQKTQIERVSSALAELRKQLDGVLHRNQQMITSNTALGRSWNYMKNRLAFYFTVGASTQFVKNLIEVRSQYEMNERALGILVDSAERGTQIFNELSQMALVSPYTLIELSTAAKQLTAYDVAAKDVVDTTRRLADMASAVGIPIERLTYALGQIKAYGYLNSRDARMFANAGIPLVKELAEHYTKLEGHLVSTADVYDRIKKKAIDYNDVMQVMNEMMDEGGKFFNFQEKMAGTLKVQLANLTLAWNNMLNDIGESEQGFLAGSIGVLKELFLQWHTINRVIYDMVIVFGIAKAAQLALNVAIGKGVASVDAAILANKRRIASELERKALTQSLTAEEERLLATKKMVTAADYQQILSSKTLTKQQAMMLLVVKGRNKELATALIRMGLLTAAEIRNITATKLMSAAWKSAGIALKSLGASMLAALPAILITTAIFAIVDAIQFYREQSEKTVELNKKIAENAKEASKAISDFLKDSVKVGNRMKAISGTLSPIDAQKTWDALREQIELSSDASSTFIAKLLEEEDINKRIANGFTVAESIRDATNALADLDEKALQISQDSWLNGLFGEGLAEDIEDYIEEIQKGRANGENIGSKYFAAGEYNEAMNEITEFANNAEIVIRDRLRAGVNDATQLKEAVERIKKEVTAANPQIKGEVKKWFDVEVDRLMAERFGSVYNELSSLQSAFIEHIKRDSGAALRRLSDDILDTSKQLDDEVLDAIGKAWNKLKDELPPEAQDLISKLQKQFDDNPLSLRVLLVQAGEVQERDPIQKDYERHFYDDAAGDRPQRPKDVGTVWDYDGNYEKYAAARKKHEAEMVEYNQKNAEWESKRAALVSKYGDFNKKTDETRGQWAKRINDEIKAATEEETAAQHTISSLEKELSLEQRKDDARYKAAVADKTSAAERKKAAQEAYNYEKLYQEEKAKGGSKKDPLLDTLKNTIDIIKKAQSEYDTLTSNGKGSAAALNSVFGRYSKTLTETNTKLREFGLPEIELSKLIKGRNPNEILNFFERLSNILTSKGLSNLERQKAVEGVIQEFGVKAETYNLDMITKGLNSELGKLKDEYELAVELDADPELGNAFANMMGIDMESLPHTVKEYADEYSKYLNKYLKGKNSTMQLTGDELRGLTRDDINALQSQVDDGTFNQEWFDAIKKAYDDISAKRKKDIEDTEKWKNGLIEKYGDLQDKLTKIYKDSVQNQVNAVKTFGTEDQKSDIVRLQLRLEATDNPAELTEINTEIAKIVKDVTDKNPIALKLVTASDNQTKSDTSKAYWEDFKNSELYSMTFEDMANNSTRAIQLIMDKLEMLKDKVKEDPASMKALIKSLEDAQKELNARDPFGGVARSLRNMATASQETKTAQEALWRAEVDVEQAQQEVDNSEDGTPEQQAAAQQKLANAVQRRAAAQAKLAQAENKGKKAQEDLKSSLQGMSNQLGNVQELFGVVSKLFRAGGDDETADAIDAISEGFSTMTTVIMGVVAAMVVLESSQPWLLAIAAALSVIVGLVSFLSGNENKKIDAKIKDSELAVKRLELAYVDLQQAIDRAYGSAVVGAKRAALANKALQLEEIKRQLQLERSRKSKKRDEDKIIDLEKQYKELYYEIKNGTREIVDDLLGTDVGGFAENLVSSMIDAFKKGEEYMKVFNDSFDDMIDNMIMKAIVSKVVASYMDKLWDDLDDRINKRSENEAKEFAKIQNKNAELSTMSDADIIKKYYKGDDGVYHYYTVSSIEKSLKKDKYKWLQDWVDKYRIAAEEEEKAAKNRLDAVTDITNSDIDYTMSRVSEIMPELGEKLKSILGEYYKFGQDSDKNLSALQAGISGITEDQAGALEAYWNANTQQQYVQSDLLTQIRDTIQGFDMDVQLATMGQILLQLQQSYQVQMSIQNILEGVLTPSGRSFSVELVS